MAERNTFEVDVEGLLVLPVSNYASEDVEIYTNRNLPRPQLTRDALEAYSRYSGALFYLFPMAEITEIFKQVYWTAGGATRGVLCALCALASLGYHYDVEDADIQVIQKFYNTAKVYIDVCLEEDPIYGMRVQVLLAANCIMEKKNAAWTWIQSALNIAKEQGFATPEWHQDENYEKRITLQKNWLTTVFFHTWLTATVRSRPTELPYNPHDVIVLAARIKAMASSRIDSIRSELHSIGIILSGILQDSPQRGDVNLNHVRFHAAETERWLLGLPDFMQLASLLEGDSASTNVQRRTTLLVHILFQGACMQLHRPTLLYLAAVHRDSPWTLDGTREQAAESADTCVRSALQTAQIIYILLSDNAVFKRCWIVIHQSFVAALILIFNAGQKKKHGAPRAAYQDEIERIEVCMRALEFCGTIDRVASGYHTRLALYCDALLRPNSPHIDGQPSNSNASIARTPDAATLMEQHPRTFIDIFNQPFFDAIHQQTGDWQESLPQWLEDDDEMTSFPRTGFLDGTGDDEIRDGL